MDGEVIIGTRLDSKQLEKDLNASKKQLERYEKEAEKLTQSKAKAEVDLQPYKEQKKMIEEMTDQALQYAQTEKAVKEQLETEEILIDELNKKYSSQLGRLSEINKKIKDNSVSQEMMKSKIEETNEKLKQSKGFDSIKDHISDIGKGLDNTVKKVMRWGLAVFGIRSAYNAVRRAMSTLSQYDDDMATNVEYITYLLASTLEPVVKRIIELVNTLLAYINYIFKAWTGKDLFNASKYFEKINKESAKTAKNAKEIKKQLAGFDEMNVLQADGSVSGISMPSLPKLEDVPIPEWIKWIADNKDGILNFIKTAGILIAGLKLADLLIKVSGIGKGLFDIFGVMKNIGALGTLIFIAGIATAIVGVITLIQGVIAYIQDPSWENFGEILDGLTWIIFGVGTALVALNASNPLGWILIATGAVMNFVDALIEDRTQIMNVDDAQKQLEQSTKNVMEATNNYTNAIDRAKDAQKKLEDAERKTGLSGKDLYEQVQDNYDIYNTFNDAQKDVLGLYLENEKAQNNVKDSITKLSDAKKQEAKDSIELALSNAEEEKSYDSLKEKVTEAYDQHKIDAKEAQDYIERIMGNMSDAERKTFAEDLPGYIKEGLEPTRYASWGNKLKNWFSGLWDSIWGKAPKTAEIVASSNLKGYNFATGAMVYSNIPKLAAGGIINQPGYGVPLASAIGGERGYEGVVPLTDQQAMAELGAEIGRNVVINLTNITQLDNRQIARAQKQINAENDFAYNR